MKKILFGTTALLAAGAFVSTAQASDPIKLQLGGYMKYWVAAADQASDFKSTAGTRVNNFDVQGDSEIFFKGTTTLDNGMKIGVQVELEAGSNNNTVPGEEQDIIDESYMWLEGKYGKLIIGSENDAAYLSHVGAPEASEMGSGINEGDTNKYLLIPSNTRYLDAYVGLDATGDANKLTYFTPSFYGFQGGLSYTPSNDTAGDDALAASETIAKANAGVDDTWSFVVNYNNKFGGVGVKANASYVLSDATGATTTGAQETNIQDFGGGLNVSYMGFTVGGSAHRLIANNSVTAAIARKDGVTWDAGVQYAEGPYAVSLSYLNSSVVGNRGKSVFAKGDDVVDLWRLGAKYTLGPGVTLFGQLAYLDAQDENQTTTTAVAKANSNPGAYGGVVGLKLNF